MLRADGGVRKWTGVAGQVPDGLAERGGRDLEMAEEFDAWETQGGLVETLLPVEVQGLPDHPERKRPDTL